MAIIQENDSRRRSQSGDFQWSDVYVVCLEYWRFILLSVVFFVCCAGLYLYFAHPQYLVSGKMLVIDKNKKNSTVSAGMAMLSQIPFGLGSSLGGSLGVDNEKEIIRSKLLLRDVVNDLGLHTEYRLCKWGRNKLIYKEQPVNAVLDQAHLDKLDADIPATYRELELTIVKNDDGFDVEGELTINEDVFYVPEQHFSSLPAKYPTEIGTVMLSENKNLPSELREKYTEGYKLKITICPPIEIAKRYTDLLNVDNDLKVASSIVDLQLKDENIIRGLDFINHMVEVYNKRANEEKDEEARKNDAFVNERLAKIDAELGSSDANWENFKKSNHVTDLQLDATETMTKKSEYESKLVEIGTQQQLLDYLSEYVNNPDNQNELIPSSIGLTDEATIALIAQYNSQVQERKRLLMGSSEAAPRIQQLSSSIKNLNKSVRTALSQARQSSKIMRQNVEREYHKYMSRVNSAPQQERVLTEIGRERGIKQSVYLMMLQKREENAMDLANTSEKGKFIDQPSFERKVQPRGGILLVVALLLGLLLPVILFLVLKKSRARIESSEELSLLTGKPVSGLLPKDSTNTDDAFRALRSNVKLHIAEGQKIFMLTSPRQGCGTTYVAVRLAKALAYSGQKVVLCDLNFRHPSLSEEDRIGMASLLIKSPVEVLDVKRCLTPSRTTAGLDYLPAGDLRRGDSADLIAHDNLRQVVDHLKSEYDVVILDTATLCDYPDSLQLGSLSDAVYVICQVGKTSTDDVKHLSSQASAHQFPPLNYIINQIDMTQKKYRYYFKHVLSLLLVAVMFCACGSSQNVAYFKNADTIDLGASQVLYEAHIMPKDILTITVSTINPEAATTFNMTVPTVINQRQNASSTSQPALQSYLVGNDGTIQFPVLGTLHVGGLTTKEAEQLILKQILPYMAEAENPIVTVRLSSYSISVMGEVQNPGCYQVSREKVTVLEALSMAGDLTIYGVRNNVRLIREDASGKKSIYKIDLNDANLLNSPYYYLQQNDVLYVEPNKAKAQNSNIGSMTTLWFSATSIVVSIASLLVNIFR